MKHWIPFGLALVAGSSFAKTKIEVTPGMFNVRATFAGEEALRYFNALGVKETEGPGDTGQHGPSKLGDSIEHRKGISNEGAPASDLFTNLECIDEIFWKTGKRFETRCEVNITTATPDDNVGYIVRSSASPLAKTLYDGLEKEGEEKVVKNQDGTPSWTERALLTSDRRVELICTHAAKTDVDDAESYRCFTHIYTKKSKP